MEVSEKMSESVKLATVELKETMKEMMIMFETELSEKNKQLAQTEQALYAQQQLTIQANVRIKQLERHQLSHPIEKA